MTSSISGTSNVKDGIAYWEKQVKDVNDVDEKFSNSRDLGYLRLNYSRLTAVGSLAKYDKEDNYKVTVQSNGKLSISIRNASAEDEKVLDLSKYEEALDELKKQTDPEGWAKEQEEKKQKEAEQNLIEVTAPGSRCRFIWSKNGLGSFGRRQFCPKRAMISVIILMPCSKGNIRRLKAFIMSKSAAMIRLAKTKI